MKQYNVKKDEKKSALSKNIVWIVLILAFTGLLELGIGYTFLKSYHREVKGLENKINEIYMTKINQTLALLNNRMRSMIFSGSEIQNIHDAYASAEFLVSEQYKMGDILLQNHAVSELKKLFLNMSDNYGSEFNFFYYDLDYELMVEYGGSEYVFREPFIDMVLSKINQGSMTYSKDGKWYMLDDYMLTVYKGDRGIGGVWMRAEDFARNIFFLSPTPEAKVEIFDQMTNRVLVYTRQENGTLLRSEVVKADNDFYRMLSAGFSWRFVLNTRSYDNALIYPMIFGGMLVSYLVLVLIVLIYIKRNILGQVNYFYKHLLSYRQNVKFNEESGLVEFAEAGKVLNQLAEEIEKLKIDIYEEQIARQAVDLDYAQIQIRPHFYINCLNVIYSMAQLNRIAEIQEIAVAVSDYLRYIFQKSLTPVPIKRELVFIEKYLHVLECLNGFEYQCDVLVENNLDDFCVPPLLLQTFVENSVKHNLDKQGGFCVRISVKQVDNGGCNIVICDNGSGFDQETLEALNVGRFTDSATHHIGIKNALARLTIIYGSEAKVSFDNIFDGGARVCISIPGHFD